jgi:hypothetical protein
LVTFSRSNPQNQPEPLFYAMDCCVKISEGQTGDLDEEVFLWASLHFLWSKQE